MKLLLDTHFVIWLALDPSRVSGGEHELINTADRRFISVVSLWELRIKWNQRDRFDRRKGALDPARAVEFAEVTRCDLASLTPAECLASLDPPAAHRDPFDEMLLVHAQRLGARLLTRDRRLVAHPLALAA